jgi:hypothetical protein
MKEKMSTQTIQSKRFVVRKSLIGKNVTIEFTNKKGNTITYNHDIVWEIMKDKLSVMPCWLKYKSYTATNNIPMICRNTDLVEMI